MANFGLKQDSFRQGEWGKVLRGRSRLEGYAEAAGALENFVPLPGGAITRRPGLEALARIVNVANPALPSTDVRIVPFITSDGTIYLVQIQANYILVLDTAGAQQATISTTYTASEVWDIDMETSGDIMYLVHPSHAPAKLVRVDSTPTFRFFDMGFDPPPTYEAPVYGSDLDAGATLTPGAATGTGVTFTAGAAVFLSGDVGRHVVSKGGRAKIVQFTDTTHVVCDIIDDFSGTSAIAAADWYMQYTSGSQIQASIKGQPGQSITIASLGNEGYRNALLAATGYWTASPAACAAASCSAGIYYLTSAGKTALGVTAKPSNVYENGESLVEGDGDTLGVKQWDWDDLDSLGYNTIYIRLSDDYDPDSKYLGSGANYIQYSSSTAGDSIFRSADVGKYIHMLGGVAKISAFVSATQVTGVVIKEMSDILDDTSDADYAESRKTYDWTLESAAWNATDGYPRSIKFHGDALWFGGTSTFPMGLWRSVVSDYQNFSRGVDDSDGMFLILTGSRETASVEWMESKDSLIVGTAKHEHTVSGGGQSKSIAPTSVDTDIPSRVGSSRVNRETVDVAILFVQRGKKKLREMTYQWESEAYASTDLTELNPEISSTGIRQIAMMLRPYPILWAVTEDGLLISLTYDRPNKVAAWARHPLPSGWTAVSVAAVQNDTTGLDDIYVSLIYDNDTFLAKMSAFFEDSQSTYTANKGLNAFFVDMGYKYSGASTVTIEHANLGWLVGQTVQVLADGARHPDVVVEAGTGSNGKVTLQYAVTLAHIGLGAPAMAEQLPVRAEIPREGDSTGRDVSVNEVIVEFDRTQAAQISLGPLANGTYYDIPWRSDFDPMDTPDELFTGTRRVSHQDASTQDEGKVRIRAAGPTPITVLSITRRVEV